MTRSKTKRYEPIIPRVFAIAGNDTKREETQRNQQYVTFNQVVDGFDPIPAHQVTSRASDIFQRPYFSGCRMKCHLRTAWIGCIFERHLSKAIFINDCTDNCARPLINDAPVKCSSIHFTKTLKTLVLLFLDQN